MYQQQNFKNTHTNILVSFQNRWSYKLHLKLTTLSPSSADKTAITMEIQTSFPIFQIYRMLIFQVAICPASATGACFMETPRWCCRGYDAFKRLGNMKIILNSLLSATILHSMPCIINNRTDMYVNIALSRRTSRDRLPQILWLNAVSFRGVFQMSAKRHHGMSSFGWSNLTV